MQHKKTIAIPATTKEVIDRTTCDFCGCDIKAPPFHVADVTITREVGTNYPEGGGIERTAYDCCLACWANKIDPALRALGATPRTEEWDF